MGHRIGNEDQGNVVKLSDVRGPGLRPALAQIEAYWQMTRRGRIVPARSDIDPRGLQGALDHAFILERISTGLARFRVSGSHLNDLMGLEVRGMPMSAIFVPEARETLSDAIATAFDTPATIRISLMSEPGFGRPKIDGTMLMLPLRSDLGDITRILGGIVMSGPVGRTPRRLAIVDQKRKSLTGYAGTDPTPADRSDRPGGRPRDPDTNPKTSAGRDALTKGGFLRLISDNDRAE